LALMRCSGSLALGLVKGAAAHVRRLKRNLHVEKETTRGL
jgi:hypothetical protein